MPTESFYLDYQWNDLPPHWLILGKTGGGRREKIWSTVLTSWNEFSLDSCKWMLQGCVNWAVLNMCVSLTLRIFHESTRWSTWFEYISWFEVGRKDVVFTLERCCRPLKLATHFDLWICFLFYFPCKYKHFFYLVLMWVRNEWGSLGAERRPGRVGRDLTCKSADEGQIPSTLWLWSSLIIFELQHRHL